MRLLDTDVLSSLASPRVPGDLQRRLRTNLEALPVVYTSAVNLAEILSGLDRKDSPRLRATYETRVFPLLVVLPFDESAADQYGRLRAMLEARGTPLGECDLMVASVALSHGLVLVTGNVAHFSRVPGLGIEDWLS